MHFDFSEDQLLFQRAVRDFLEKECTPARVRGLWATETGRSRSLWKKLAELAGPIAFGIAQHGDDQLVREAVDRVRRRQVCLLLDLFRLDHLVDLRRALVGGVDDVDPARSLAGYDQEAA